MGNFTSNHNSSKTLRIMSYNVEWGFLNLPSDIHQDSCGHIIPNTSQAQELHLKLISKNIGILYPDICFLQEIGSLEAIQYIKNQLTDMFNLKYKCYYSNGEEKGSQGVGILVIDKLDNLYSVENIPNFKLNRALGINLNYNNRIYKFIGVHLKSLYDQKINKDQQEQIQQLSSVLDWIKDCSNSIICGDFNNIPDSKPINYIKSNKYIDVFENNTFVNNILNNKNTEFYRKNLKNKEQGSRIDYIFIKGDDLNIQSSHIINIQRECIEQNLDMRGETSDHLPIMAIISIQ